ncbi:amidohydrolase [Paucibacter sp. M5-1]|uniref:amidohydrolase n=1 Tax=Paucibacter sp. M5-1 TaxID=3015998 RepID=UPI0022B8828B|nr:amidohydrolase [Paucibacter sp. M5-1]MCZ7880410.1 amidohydrolase [Paucibacter sp. M5-1]
MNAKVTTLDLEKPTAEAVAIKGGKILAVGSTEKVMLNHRGTATKVIDAGQRRLIPGLNDSHSHYLRGGMSFTGELRWDGVPSLSIGLDMVKQQAAVTPKGQWVRVVGGFTPWQFSEKRMPTPQELDAVAPNTPVFVQYFYSEIVINKAGLRALNITKDTKFPEGSETVKDAKGNPTGVFRATPSPNILYGLLAKLPTFDQATAEQSSQYFFHQLARFGLTSVIDAGGGGFNFPDDYAASIQVMRAKKLPLRVSFYLFTQNPGKELEDYQNWMKDNSAGHNFDEIREHGFELEGGGEWVLWKAGDYENFRSARPTQEADMEEKLEPVVRLFVKNRWPFRIHATYDESVTRLMNVIEKVNKDTPLNGLRFAIDHAETLKAPNMDRIKALGGGVAIQDRMFFLGDDFVEQYGAKAAENAPPVRQLMAKGIPVGMGTDGTRSSFNPWLALYFLTTGKVASERTVLGPNNRVSREEALGLYTFGSAWFSQEESVKGRIKDGQFADMALLSADYMTVPDKDIKSIESVLTIVDGKAVYGAGPFASFAPSAPAIVPNWSPNKKFGSFYTGR